MQRKYQFSNFIKSYLLNGFVNSFNSVSDNVWQPFTEYPVGTVVSHSYINNFETVSNKYIALSGYKSGNNPPVHTDLGSVQTDGGIRWMFVSSSSTIEQGLFNLYLTFGRKDQWGNSDYPVEADINLETSPQSISDIIYAKKIDKNHISVVTDRNTWKSGTVYDEYQPDKKEYKKPHYVTNHEGYIYYCLYNNKGAESSIEPVGGSSEPINTLDGYIWYYVAKVDLNNTKFATDEYIPLTKDIAFNPYLDTHRRGIAAIDMSSLNLGAFNPSDDLQVDILNGGIGSGAEFNVIRNNAGVIERIEIAKSGQNYDKGAVIVIKKLGVTGNGAVAEANVGLNGKISGITIKNGGTGYVKANVIIEGDGTGATATATISQAGSVVDIVITDAGKDYTYANIYIVAGEHSVFGNVRLLPYNTNKTDLMSTFAGNSILILTDVYASADYFNYDSYYRENMLVVNMYEKGHNHIADKSEYIGHGHPEWSNDKSKLRKIEQYDGLVLFRQTTEKVLHVANQSERIKILIGL